MPAISYQVQTAVQKYAEVLLVGVYGGVAGVHSTRLLRLLIFIYTRSKRGDAEKR